MTDTTEETQAVAPVKAPKPDMRAGGKVRGLIPQSIEEAARLAEGYFRSGMTPESYIVKAEYIDDKQNKIVDIDAKATCSRLMIGIMKGMEVGLPPVAALSSIYIVNNRPTIYGDGALALVLDSGLCGDYDETLEGTPKTDDWVATCTIERVGKKKPIVRTFSWLDAKAAGLVGKAGPWSKYTARQMQMRARAFALRDGFADVLLGLGITEEVADIDPPQQLEKQKPEIQQDQFTMKALENKPSETVDFSTLEKAKPEPVAVDVATKVIMEAAQTTTPGVQPADDRGQISTNPEDRRPPVDPVEHNKLIDSLGASDKWKADVPEKTPLEQAIDAAPPKEEKPKAAADAFPGCATCQGKGWRPWEQTDPETGEVTEGTEPCPECSKPPAEPKPAENKKPDIPDDLFFAG